MPAVPKRKSASRRTMSVYPPPSVAAPLGGYKSTVFNTALRLIAHLLTDPALKVQHVFSAKEWDYLYHSFTGRSVEPETLRPGHYLAEAAEMRHARSGAGAELDPKAPDKAVEILTKKLRELDYLHAWAVVVAITWRGEYDHETAGEGWYTLAYREQREREMADSDE